MIITTESAREIADDARGATEFLDSPRCSEVIRRCADALIAVSQERDRLRGEAEVLRGLLREADFVLKSVAEHDEDEGMRALRMMIAAAIYRDVRGSEWVKVS